MLFGLLDKLAVFLKASLTSIGVNSGCTERIKAHTPAVIGVEKDVPPENSYELAFVKLVFIEAT